MNEVGGLLKTVYAYDYRECEQKCKKILSYMLWDEI